MPKLTLDFSSVGEVVPEGDYEVQVVKASVGKSQSGNPMFTIQYTVEGGEYDGRTLFDNVPLLPQTMWRMRIALIGLGFDQDAVSGKAFELEPDDLLGRRARVTVSHREWEGSTRANITRYSPLVSAEVMEGLESLEDDELDDFFSDMEE